MRNLKYIFGCLLGGVLGCFVCTARVEASISTYNDGSMQSTPEGIYVSNDSIAKSYEDCDFYDCSIPYNTTIEEVGGYAIKAISLLNNGKSYSEMKSSTLKCKVGTKVALYGKKHIVSNKVNKFPNCTISTEDSTGALIIKDKNGNEYYTSAIQNFFYNFGGVFFDASFPKEPEIGQLFDVILTDGTCIHFVVCDENSKCHTNGNFSSDDGESAWEVSYTESELKNSNYRWLFQSANGNCIELGCDYDTYGNSVTTSFLDKYNIGSESGQNQIMYYRLYNLNVNEGSIKRSASVGKSVSYYVGKIGSSSLDNSNSGLISGSSLVSEWSLQGMPSRSDLLDSQNKIYLKDYSNLSIRDKVALSLITENINTMKNGNKDSFINILISFIGLCLLVYSVGFLVCLVLDRVNSFIDISFLKCYTFGKIEYDPFEAKSLGNDSTLTRLLISVGVLFAVGLALSSGVANVVIGYIIKFTNSLLG